MAEIEKYRISAGYGTNCAVGQVDVAGEIIVATPAIWRKFIGQQLHQLEWWLAKKYGSIGKVRIP